MKRLLTSLRESPVYTKRTAALIENETGNVSKTLCLSRVDDKRGERVSG